MSRLPPHVGVYIIAVWSVVLGLQHAVRLFTTTGIGLKVMTVDLPPMQLFAYQALNLAFVTAFFLAGVGLWRITRWGWRLFTVTIILFFVIGLGGLFLTTIDTLTTIEKWIQGMRYILAAALPLAYLNLPHIRALFEKE